MFRWYVCNFELVIVIRYNSSSKLQIRGTFTRPMHSMNMAQQQKERIEIQENQVILSGKSAKNGCGKLSLSSFVKFAGFAIALINDLCYHGMFQDSYLDCICTN